MRLEHFRAHRGGGVVVHVDAFHLHSSLRLCNSVAEPRQASQWSVAGSVPPVSLAAGLAGQILQGHRGKKLRIRSPSPCQTLWVTHWSVQTQRPVSSMQETGTRVSSTLSMISSTRICAAGRART